ncbi:peptide synthetase [Sorangium cellulosum]|uniref:Peptide synthetase n=2 Tax=Sorangium cellulosum TaxID=56 RepID=A0A2L0F245_SORCE|nr:non-ribosomal peptide synthetase/type I polyketide synthase [Sorangium cellulosum]AUX45571.1 peptide synthetase [Sorangium cellulosum]
MSRECSYAPLSFEQERMWLLVRLHGALAAFHERGGAWLDGEIDTVRLTRAVEAVATRHEILRTTFAERDGKPVQVISPEAEIALDQVDLSAGGRSALDDDALAIARDEVSIPFDIELGPLWRVSLIRARPGRYLFVISMHHIISDGDLSISLLLREVFFLYHGVELPAPALQYQDHTRWQLVHVSGELHDRQLAYWRAELAGSPTALEMPLDRPRLAAQTFAGATAERTLDRELLRELRSFAQDDGTDLSALLLAALGAVLHRHSRQDDILIGTPLCGRDRPGTSGVIGYFGNPVAIRARFAPDPSFRDFLRQVRRAVQQARANGDVSFRALVEELSPPRDPSRTPFFQVLFNMRPPRAPRQEGALFSLRPVDVELPYAAYELIVTAQEQEDDERLSLKVEYNRDLFEHDTMFMLLEHIEVLLRGALKDPERRLSKLPILTEAERRRILVEWNSNSAMDPPRERIHVVFEEQARRAPDAVAVVFEGEQLTYAELDRKGNQVARLLRKLGVGPDGLVGISMERSVDMIVAMLGILKAGGAYVPFDPSYPVDRLAFMLEDTQLRVVLTHERLASWLPGDGVEVVRFDADKALIDDQPEGKVDPLPGEGPENLAYVMYTSGSAGKPKGVAIEHRCVLSLLVNTDYVTLGPEDRIAQAANASFDAATFEIWGALMHGAQLVGIARDITLSPPELARTLRERRITTLFLPAALFHQLAGETPGALAGVRTVIVGGDTLDPERVRKVLECGAPERLLNGYGPTEATTFAAWYHVRSVPPEATAIPLGRPIAHTTIYILDSNLDPVPPGVSGELYIGGEGVGRGYFRRPELTAERFMSDPFASKPGASMYRTGDLARHRSGGIIEFLGRIDHQVKIRGFRVELGEIEAALREHPAVREAVVLAWATSQNEKKLVAYIVPERPQVAHGFEGALVPALREFLKSKLPGYMIPPTLIELGELPITPNGKVDRKRLPVPDSARMEVRRELVAPRSELEEALADIWKELLRLDQIGVHDNFFELGGHSLHAVKLFSRVHNTFGVSVKFHAFFAHPTIAELAVLMRRERSAHWAESSIPAAPRRGPMPLSFGQERLWFLSRLSPESRAYNCMFPFRLTGPVDVRALDRSLRKLVERHDILRTVYGEDEGRPAQIVNDDATVRLDVADLQHLSAEERATEVQQRIDAAAHTLFDLERGPLFQAGLLRLGPEEHVLWIHLHHLTMDGWSTEVAFRELGAIYERLKEGAPPALPELPIRYVDFAVWQRERMKGDALSALLGWWRAHLVDAPPLLDLPADHPRPPVQTFRGSAVHYRLPASVVKPARALAVQQDMTLTMVLLSAVAVLLSRYTRRDDILIGMPSANRDRVELERVMGFFVNTLPIRLDLSGDPTFEELLKRARRVCLEVYEHDALPFDRLVQDLQLERTTSYNPLVQVAFAPQPPAGRDLHLDGLVVERLDIDAKKTVFDLTIYSWESADGVVGTFEYSTDLFERATMEQMVNHLLELLAVAVSHPDRRVSSISIAIDPARRVITTERSEAADYMRIEAALREHPAVRDAVALARKDGEGDEQVIAYVVPGPGGGGSSGRDSALRAEHISEWLSLYDETYGSGGSDVDPEFNVTGWNSSYTGEPLDQETMRKWREATLDRLMSLAPERVWEIGCGTGLLLLRMAPRCGAYLGTDFSQHAVSTLRSQLAGDLSRVVLQRREANDFTNIEPESFDAIILNSTVQYFPDPHYLRSVIEGAVRATAPGGVVFVGDVRSLPLLEAFRTSVELYRAPPGTARSELLDRIYRAVSNEKELVLAPDYFRALCDEVPRVIHAEIWLKRGYASDEMTRYRFDAVLYVGGAPEPVSIDRSVPWSRDEEITALEDVERLLCEERPQALELLGVPNARVHADVLVFEALRSGGGADLALAEAALAGRGAGAEPEALWELGERLGYSARVTWSRVAGPGAMDVLFERSASAQRPRPWMEARKLDNPSLSSRTNNPLRKRQTRDLVPRLRAFLQAKLPDHMLPAAIVKLEALPLTESGEVDRRALPPLDGARPAKKHEAAAVTPDIEAILTGIWRKVLDAEDVGLDDPFFELGGHSLLLAQVRAALETRTGFRVPIVDLFQYPTIRSLAAHLRARFGVTGAGEGTRAAPPAPASHRRSSAPVGGAIQENDVAIIGMAGRFPKARDTSALWYNLIHGVEAISFYTADELAALGVKPELIGSPSLVPAFGALEDALCFDAGFFGYSPSEARLVDPQQRVFLECAWEAVEMAGYNPFSFGKPIGVFAGSDAPGYWMERIGFAGGPLTSEDYRVYATNLTDGLTTRVAYKLGLRGPAVTVLTACSTSLVAVHLGCRSLLTKECDMVLAGGAVVHSPTRIGHVYEEGSLLSPDGHVRPFDADAGGTVNGSGVGAVVLKRLRDAIDDGDTIHAVIRGSAVTNDGARKVGYMAPGLDGQFETIARAHAAAGVSPESITYVEAHGTGTKLGDPVEVAALTRAFREGTSEVGFCALGSVKSNVGHLGAAAGVTGLIKAVLSLKHEKIPPTLHFRRPNPELHLESSPFFVNSRPIEWKRGARPRRAGVSSFGAGGTNAHVVLEEAPELAPSGPSRICQLLVLSARTEGALEVNAGRLVAHIRTTPGVSLPDVAFTLQQGRVALPHRRAIVCRDAPTAAARLTDPDPIHVHRAIAGPREPAVVFMFPGVGTQQLDMGRELYTGEPAYREGIDACASLFRKELSMDIVGLLFPDAQSRARVAEQMLRSRANLAAIFSTEYALAQLLLSWGVRPAALTGHSLGEYAAACIAGVLSLEDAVSLVAARGRLYEELPDDTLTLIVHLSEDALLKRLPDGISLAAVNGEETCVVSGPGPDVRRFETELSREGRRVKRLPISAAVHSSLVEPFMARLTSRAASMVRKVPRIPMISNLTGDWLTDAEALDPSYWARHLRGTVRFADGLAVLLANPDHVFVEVGPGSTLTTLSSRHPRAGARRLVTNTMRSPGSGRADMEALLAAVGRLWCAGVNIDWSAFSRGERRRRVPLPTYAFERIPHVLEPAASARERPASRPLPVQAANADDAGRAGVLPLCHSRHEAEGAADAPPRTHLERAVTSLWQHTLGLGRIGVNDNFFELGGDSLIAIRLLSRLRERFAVPLDPNVLLNAPTVAALSSRIEEALREGSVVAPAASPATAAPSTLVEIQRGSLERPLFLVHPVGGNVYCYVELARQLGLDQAIYGLRSPGIDGQATSQERIEDMARAYLDRIRSVQQEGPYSIAGWSFGGVVAFEMASQLMAEGQLVVPPILVDSVTPTLLRGVMDELDARMLAWFAADLEAIAEVSVAEQAAALGGLHSTQRLQYIFDQIRRSGTASELVDLEQLERLFHVFACNMRALHSYVPRPYPGSMLLLRASEPLSFLVAGAAPPTVSPEALEVSASFGWEMYAPGRVEVHSVPGNHFTIMKQPNVKALADVLRQHLNRYDPRREHGPRHAAVTGAALSNPDA